MKIVFTKLEGDRHEIFVSERSKGPDIRLPARETGPTIPHDLVHAVVETALGLENGFWEAVDAGATFDGFRIAQPSRHRRAGIKELGKLDQAVFPAELAVSWAHRFWSGQRLEGRGLGAAPLSEAQMKTAAAALDSARAQWDKLAPGEALTWSWEAPRSSKRRRKA